MIVRLSNVLAIKMKVSGLTTLSADPNPCADWSCRLFTARRIRYILITNTTFLYSVVIYGKGIANADIFLKKMLDTIRDVTEHDGFAPIYETQIAPASATVSFSKALNRSVTGSMNDLIFQAKWILEAEELSPYELSFKLNEVPMSRLKYRNPKEAFGGSDAVVKEEALEEKSELRGEKDIYQDKASYLWLVRK